MYTLFISANLYNRKSSQAKFQITKIQFLDFSIFSVYGLVARTFVKEAVM